jgi:hypothetical protein
MALGPMKHKNIRWNPHTEEWFCLACGRTSDRTDEPDARAALEKYECNVPWVTMPTASPDHPGDR